MQHATPERTALLSNAAKFKQAAEDPQILLPTPPGMARRSSPPRRDFRSAPRPVSSTPRRGESGLRVSTFGIAARDYTPGGLDGYGSRAIPAVATGANVVPSPGEYDVVPKSFQGSVGISFPTSPRWTKEHARPQSAPKRDAGDAENEVDANLSAQHDGTAPGPGAYQPNVQVVRPRSAYAVLKNSNPREHGLVMQHGMPLVVSSRTATAVPGAGAYTPRSADAAAGPVTIPKSARSDEKVSPVPGPGAYTPRHPHERQSPRAVVPRDSRSVAVLTKVNSLFYTTEALLNSNLAVPGPGAYAVATSSVARPAGAATFARAPRDGRSPSPRSRNGAKDAVSSSTPDEEALHPTSIAANVAKKRGGFTFGKQARDQRFVAVGSRMLLQSRRSSTELMPGVGAYAADKVGTIAEAVQDALRRSPKRGGFHDLATTPRSPKRANPAPPVPGPGAYDARVPAVRVDTHNHWLRDSIMKRTEHA